MSFIAQSNIYCAGVFKLCYGMYYNYAFAILLTTQLSNCDSIVTIDEIAYTSIQAVDEDDDALVYSLTSEYFSIHPSTGVIYVAKSLLDSPTGQDNYCIVSLIQYKYYIV